VNLKPEELKREIDDTLAELDRLEAEVVELFGELLGDEAALRVAAYMRAKERDPSYEVFTREASSGPSTAPPATR
jgi:hypothetical protein